MGRLVWYPSGRSDPSILNGLPPRASRCPVWPCQHPACRWNRLGRSTGASGRSGTPKGSTGGQSSQFFRGVPGRRPSRRPRSGRSGSLSRWRVARPWCGEIDLPSGPGRASSNDSLSHSRRPVRDVADLLPDCSGALFWRSPSTSEVTLSRSLSGSAIGCRVSGSTAADCSTSSRDGHKA